MRGPWLGRTYTDGILTQGHHCLQRRNFPEEGCPVTTNCVGLWRFASHHLRFDANSLGLELCPDTTMAQRRIATTAR